MADNQPNNPTADDFQTLFEESLRSVKPGGVVKGRVVGITSSHVMVNVGDEIDVYFDSSESEGGGIVLSRQRAENMKVWEDIEKAAQDGSGVEGVIVAKVRGGFKVDLGVAAFLPGSHVDIRPTRNLDWFLGQRDKFAILKFNR